MQCSIQKVIFLAVSPSKCFGSIAREIFVSGFFSLFGCMQQDLSDLAAWVAGAATSTPSLLLSRPDRCLRLTPSPVTAGDSVSPNCGLPAFHRAPARATLGSGVRLPQCRLRPTATVRACLLSATLSPLVSPLGRVRTLSAQAYCVCRSTSPVYDPLPFAGPRGRAPTVSAKG